MILIQVHYNQHWYSFRVSPGALHEYHSIRRHEGSKAGFLHLKRHNQGGS